MYALEEKLYSAEVYLSVATAIPIVGVIGGAAKILLGTVQAITALIVTLFSGIAALCGSQKGKGICVRAAKHIVHGLGNIVAGVLESIPVIGSISGYIRLNSNKGGPGQFIYLAYGDLFKNESAFGQDKLEGHTATIGWDENSTGILFRV